MADKVTKGELLSAAVSVVAVLIYGFAHPQPSWSIAFGLFLAVNLVVRLTIMWADRGREGSDRLEVPVSPQAGSRIINTVVAVWLIAAVGILVSFYFLFPKHQFGTVLIASTAVALALLVHRRLKPVSMMPYAFIALASVLGCISLRAF